MGKAKACIAGFRYNAVYILYHRALKVLEDQFGKPNLSYRPTLIDSLIKLQLWSKLQQITLNSVLVVLNPGDVSRSALRQLNVAQVNTGREETPPISSRGANEYTTILILENIA